MKKNEISEGAIKALRDQFNAQYPEEEHIAIAEARRNEYRMYGDRVFFLQLGLVILEVLCGLTALLLDSDHPRNINIPIQPGLIAVCVIIFVGCALGTIRIFLRKKKLREEVAWEKLRRFDATRVDLGVAYYDRESDLQDIRTADQLRKLIEMDTRKIASMIHHGPISKIPSLGVDPLSAERTQLRRLESLAARLKLFSLAAVQVLSEDPDPDCHDDFVKMIDLMLCHEVGALSIVS